MPEGKYRIRYADVVATLALVIASGGTAYAASALPRHSVGAPQLKPRAVSAPKVQDQAITGPKLRPSAVTSDKIADGGISRPDLAAGAVGSNQLADGAVGPAVVADESLTVTDLAGGQNNPLTAGFGLLAGECASFSALPVPGARAGQLVTVGWLQAPPSGAVIASSRVAGNDAVALTVCNVTASSVSVPGGSTFRIVTFG